MAEVSPLLKAKIHAVRSSLLKRPPFCAGSVELGRTQSMSFYKRGQDEDNDESGLIYLNSANERQLKRLTEACSATTERYSGAWEMDPDRFATKFDPCNAGMIDFVREYLLEGVNQERGILVEMDKLNIFDRGSPSKDHANTPRNGDIFASLVVVFPTLHTSGALTLRRDDDQWILDTPTTTSALFVAFYGDVKHELSPVQSGYWVTLTYNLSFEDTIPPSQSKTVISTPSTNIVPITKSIPDQTLIRTTLTSLIQHPAFLPDGGFLGFGLRVKYTFPRNVPTNEGYQHLVDHLKGSDVIIKQVCESLSLPISLRIVINGELGDHEQVLVACSQSRMLREEEMYPGFTGYLVDSGAIPVYETGTQPLQFIEAKEIVWITPRSEEGFSISKWGDGYSDVCLVARVGRPKRREVEKFDLTRGEEMKLIEEEFGEEGEEEESDSEDYETDSEEMEED